MKKSETVQILSDYLVKWIIAKQKSLLPESKRGDDITETHIFGHDWNSMFPRGNNGKPLLLAKGVRETLYSAMCILFRDEQLFYKDKPSHLIDRYVEFLKQDKLVYDNYGMGGSHTGNGRSVMYIIYHQLTAQQEFDDRIVITASSGKSAVGKNKNGQ